MDSNSGKDRTCVSMGISNLTSSIRGVSGQEEIYNIARVQASRLEGDTMSVTNATFTNLYVTNMEVVNASITVASIDRYKVVNATITNASIQKLRAVNASFNNASIYAAKISILRSKIVSKNANYNATPSDNTIVIGGVVAASVHVTLPYATVQNKGVNLTIVNTSTLTVVASCRTGQTIEGVGKIKMNSQYDKATFLCATVGLWVEK